MKISILTPSYNQGKYLDRCIQSVLNQNYDEFEHIVIDGGSTDESISILKKYEQSDTRIKVINKENGGVSSARNMGIKASTGDYLYFLDGDDTIG